MAVKAKTAHTSGQAAKRAGFKIIVNLHYQLETATTTCTLRPRQCNRTLGNRSWWLKKKIMSVPTRMWAPSMLDGTFSQVLDPTNPSSTDPLIFGCFLPSMRWISPSQQPARIAVRTSRNRWVFGASKFWAGWMCHLGPPKNGTKTSFQEAFGRFGMSRATVGSMVLLMAEILHQFASGVSPSWSFDHPRRCRVSAINGPLPSANDFVFQTYVWSLQCIIVICIIVIWCA